MFLSPSQTVPTIGCLGISDLSACTDVPAFTTNGSIGDIGIAAGAQKSSKSVSFASEGRSRSRRRARLPKQTVGGVQLSRGRTTKAVVEGSPLMGSGHFLFEQRPEEFGASGRFCRARVGVGPVVSGYSSGPPAGKCGNAKLPSTTQHLPDSHACLGSSYAFGVRMGTNAHE